MLSQLTIRNYAIVDALDMDFKAGMSVITGETGAGKSIILGALGLTLGDRADKSVLRSGSKRTEICTEFDLSKNPQARKWLRSHDLLDPGEQSETCLLRRLINEDGRSKAYINGSPVTLGNLAEFGDMLIDIHSQHEHQSLLRRATHQRLLDEFGVNADLLTEVHNCWQAWAQNQQLIESLSNESEEFHAQIKLVGYQVTELDELAPQAGESDKLEKEFQRLDNAENNLAALHLALKMCRDDESHNITQAISKAHALLLCLPDKDSRITSILELLDTAAIQIDEAASELQQTLEGVEINPQRLEWVNQRLAELHQVARKHKVKPTELYRLHQEMIQQLKTYQNSDHELEQLQLQDIELRNQYAESAARLSQQRSRSAKKLSSLIDKQLAELGMADASLEIKLSPTTVADPSASGMESVEFLISTNPGQLPKPLVKIASGGELSRISLAIQVITAKTSNTPTLVFDEIDVGIGGGIAKVVGKLLRELADHTQILCVTHQAQVASQGHNHYFVSKQSTGKTTNTAIAELDGGQKVKEVARMLGGEEYTNESLAHAEQMVASH